NQENDCRRFTRLASKRKAEKESRPQNGSDEKKKMRRVVLGDIQNTIITSPIVGKDGDGEKPRRRPNCSRKKSREAHSPESDDPKRSSSIDEPQICEEYASDIYEYLHKMEMEASRRPLPDYLKKIQTDVTANMRGILIDWLVEVSEEYKLQSDTLYLTVSYIDLYLSKNTVNRQKLQLLGVSSMLIASKYEEITPPHVEDFCYITDNTYTKKDVVQMESDMLVSLGFQMGNPTVKTFLRRLNLVSLKDEESCNSQLELLGSYLSELSLLDYQCVKFLPSMVAASVVFLSRFTIHPEQHPWNEILQQQSGYKASELRECVSIIHDLQLSRRAGGLVAIRDKYKHHKMEFVSTLVSLPVIPVAFFDDL
ncbi:a-type cyclin, partial [Genlisea aurea]